MKILFNLFCKVVTYFAIKRADTRLKYAIMQAEKMSKKFSGERFYVMPDAFDRLIVMRRKGMRRLRRIHIMDHSVRMHHVREECFYATAGRDGIGLTEQQKQAKRRMYLSYILRNNRFIVWN